LVTVNVARHSDDTDDTLSNALADEQTWPYPNGHLVGGWLNLDIDSFGNEVTVATRPPSKGGIDSRRRNLDAAFNDGLAHLEPPAWITGCRIVATG
jgi:hypothetical protein